MSALRHELAAALGAELTGLRRLGGGDIGDAWLAELPGGRRAFVKTRDGAPPQEFQLEAQGLRWLAEPRALNLPQVLAVGTRFLALEWIEPGTLSDRGEEELGGGLAAIHAAGAAGFGGGKPLRIGSLVLPNGDAGTWGQFYAERRLQPLLGAARLPAGERRAVERLCERIDQFAGPAEAPARLHGDLWRGNVLADRRGRPWLIDPIAHGGHREVDLAMLALFGGLSERILAAYQAHTPLAAGWEERRELWQIFPLLVHAALFGGGYGAAAARAARTYVG